MPDYSKHKRTFERLQKKWYKKLAKEGFKDAETPKGNMVSYFKGNKLTIERLNTTREYYAMAEHVLAMLPQPGLLYEIWALHAVNGFMARRIARELKIPYQDVLRAIRAIQDKFNLVRRGK